MATKTGVSPEETSTDTIMEDTSTGTNTDTDTVMVISTGMDMAMDMVMDMATDMDIMDGNGYVVLVFRNPCLAVQRYMTCNGADPV